MVQVEGIELKSSGSCIEYKRVSKSCLSDKSPMFRGPPGADNVFGTAQLIRGISHSNKSINLTDYNPFKHMKDTPITKKGKNTTQQKGVKLINRICTINNKILRQTNDALVRINQITDDISMIKLSPRTGNINNTTHNDISMCEMNLDDTTLTPTA